MAGERCTIKELPTDERPRERLIRHGAESLSTSELLAIILRVGTRDYSAIGLAEQLLGRFEGLRGIAEATVEELATVKGLGAAKAAQIKAVAELGKRIAVSEARLSVSSPEDAARLLMPELRHAAQEHFKGLFLNTKNEVLRLSTITVGSLDASLITPRELFREAVRIGCASVIIAHNHPSGDPTPSSEDIQVSHRLCEAGEMIGISVLDHIVIGDGRWTSMKESGLI
ncbi:MAG: RadC family protein [Armatimonadota bacterium]